MRYYADGGPGPPTRLVRVDIGDGPGTADMEAFYAAPAQCWTPHGWVDYPQAQDRIIQEWDLSRIPEDQVPATITAVRHFLVTAQAEADRIMGRT